MWPCRPGVFRLFFYSFGGCCCFVVLPFCTQPMAGTAHDASLVVSSREAFGTLLPVLPRFSLLALFLDSVNTFCGCVAMRSYEPH